MDATTILALAIILVVDVIFIMRERRYTVTYKGSNRFGMAIPILILIIIVFALFSKSFKTTDLIVIIPMLPLAFLGNKSGVTEEGIVLNCYLTPWDKIEKFSIEKGRKDRYILKYKSPAGVRTVFFKSEVGEEVDKHLSGMRKLRHRRAKV
ncbi:MAG: DUF5673 domain-containing protein [Clostridium sp.]|nr:DUF5673 domain-containing protein [Clostridium sp.]